MPTRLKDTDVVIIGLGAAGGVAACRSRRRDSTWSALEAGTWLTRRDFAPDELRNNFRDWPQAVQKAQQKCRRIAPNAHRRPSPRPHHPSDDERCRRHDAALLGAELAAEPVGLQGRQRNDTPLRRARGFPADRRSRTGRSASRSSSRTTTRSSTRSACPGQAGNIRGKIDRRGNIFEGAARPRVSDAAAAGNRLHRHDGGRRHAVSAGTRFLGPAAINSQRYQGRSACMYHGYCNRGGCHVSTRRTRPPSPRFRKRRAPAG